MTLAVKELMMMMMMMDPVDIYTLDSLLCGHSHLHITAPPADKWLLFLTTEQEMLSIYKQSQSGLSVQLLLFYCFWLMVTPWT